MTRPPNRPPWIRTCLSLLLLLLLGGGVLAKGDGDCLECHAEVTETEWKKSVHEGNGCTSCHADLDEYPHPDKIDKVDCSMCHDQGTKMEKTVHGMALARKDPMAPTCASCHGNHSIRAKKDPESPVQPLRVAEVCQSCHAEDAHVAKERNVRLHPVLRSRTDTLHRNKGLKVTATCSSCHPAHAMFPPSNPKSNLHPDKLVETCLQCHGGLEKVHANVMKAEVWQKEPSRVPLCIDCHQPHENRTVFYGRGASQNDCMTCHDKTVQGQGRELAPVKLPDLASSTHGNVRCAQCHAGVDPQKARPCETVEKKVDCATCHLAKSEEFAASIHGQLLAKGDTAAPSCTSCHSGHHNLKSSDPASPTHPANVPALCGQCHDGGKAAAERHHASQTDVVANYSMSIHGKGLIKSGLVGTATCVSCHTAHNVRPGKDPKSSVHPTNVPETCGSCHVGIQAKFDKSVHSRLVTKTDRPLPVCSDCHTAHTISRTDGTSFKTNIEGTCGRCHQKLTESYFDTYHGKVSRLGEAATAKCADCHGAHDVLPRTMPASHLSQENIVGTCGKCHENSHAGFAGYLPHGTHNDPERYPQLYWAFWIMTSLLVGTFAFFGLHTLLWIPRSFREKRDYEEKVHRGEIPKEDPEALVFQRFDPIVRSLHLVLILSFFGLALTGMALKFSFAPWAKLLSKSLGGYASMGLIHRICAIVMVTLFAGHLMVVVRRKRRSGLGWWDFMTGPDSLVPKPDDVRQFFQTVRWFVGKGPKPEYGRFTYWEKFDYLAVFWGVGIIGATGVVLWFPEACTLVLPGWFLNVATIIHGDEALLAVGFIFTIHFFNTHFRPEKFPMDMVIFTGQISVEELKHERPAYYQKLLESGELERRLVKPVSKEFRWWAGVFGTVALFFGVGLVLAILYSLFLYQH